MDFCYLNNLLIAYYLHFDSKNEQLFRAVFLSANGVLALSAVLFGNMLVFHKIDRHVSICNHLWPVLVFYNVSRVTMPYEAQLSESERVFCQFSQGDAFFSEEGFQFNYLFPYKIYLGWLLTYYLLVFWIFDCLFSRYGYHNLYHEVCTDFKLEHLRTYHPYLGPLLFVTVHLVFFSSAHCIALVAYYSPCAQVALIFTWYAVVLHRAVVYYKGLF